MATRTDVNTDFIPSPRIIEVEAPSTEIILQDLIDTLRITEEAFTGLSYEKLINAAGKEDLGGGVLVGITANLQNAQLSFEARTTPAETGTVTTGSGAGANGLQTFVDTAADFVTAGVQRGSLVINFTDQSIADVYTGDNATTLTTRTLVNGIGNTYDIADVYQVFNIIQCNISGGNLVAEDDVDVAISPVFPTAFTQIVRTASSSATLQELQDIQFSSFNGGVTVDTTSSFTGTAFPNGTARQPVNNFTDALSIAQERGFTTFYIVGDATINSGLNFTGYTFVGESKGKTTLTIASAANVTDAEYTNATVTGDLDGGNVITNCAVNNLDFIDGFIEQCTLTGTVTLAGSINANFLDCFSGIPGTGTPTIDMGGSGSGMTLRNYNGGIRLINKTGAEAATIDLNSGQVIIDDTVTNGTIVLRGVGKWTNKDTYAGGATIVNELVNTDTIIDTLDANTYDGVAFSDVLKRLLSMATGRIVESATGVFDFYEQDNATIAFTLTKSGTQRTRS